MLVQRSRDEPSSGRGNSKKVMTALTSDCVSGSDTLDENDRDIRYIRQVAPRFYHASDPNYATGPPFPSRIARKRTVRRVASHRLLPTHTPALESHAPRGPTLFNDYFSPPITHQLVEIITSAAVASVNQHLSNIGLLPQTTLNSQPSAPPLTIITLNPPVLVQALAPAPTPHNLQ